MKVVALVALVAVASASYFEEDFSGDWESKWVQSKAKSDFGTFVSSTGKYFGDAAVAKGIKTSQDARNYALSAAFPTFSNDEKTLIIQFSVKHEQNIDCGGGYVKVFPSTIDQLDMHAGENETPYNLMFGPDICGPGHKKVHVIFAYNGKNLQTKKNIAAKSDELTHLYTLTIKSDNTYQVDIDGKKEESGSLFEDFEFLEPKEINDPALSKPSDWVDTKTIADASESKPATWDAPETISDPAAEKPEDWDDESDGAWEAPNIANPDFKGEWKAKQIPNPEYKGEWVHPQVANPKFVDDKTVYNYADFGVIGFDLWQVKAGTIFDNVLITSDAADAKAGVAVFNSIVKGENDAKSKADKEASDKAAAEEAAKKADAPAAAEEDVEDESEAKDEL